MVVNIRTYYFLLRIAFVAVGLMGGGLSAMESVENENTAFRDSVVARLNQCLERLNVLHGEIASIDFEALPEMEFPSELGNLGAHINNQRLQIIRGISGYKDSLNQWIGRFSSMKTEVEGCDTDAAVKASTAYAEFMNTEIEVEKPVEELKAYSVALQQLLTGYRASLEDIGLQLQEHSSHKSSSFNWKKLFIIGTLTAVAIGVVSFWRAYKKGIKEKEAEKSGKKGTKGELSNVPSSSLF